MRFEPGTTRCEDVDDCTPCSSNNVVGSLDPQDPELTKLCGLGESLMIGAAISLSVILPSVYTRAPITFGQPLRFPIVCLFLQQKG